MNIDRQKDSYEENTETQKTHRMNDNPTKLSFTSILLSFVSLGATTSKFPTTAACYGHFLFSSPLSSYLLILSLDLIHSHLPDHFMDYY